MLYSATMSLDGFIAGPGGDMQWMTPYLGPNPTVTELIGNIGALLIGRHTFGGDDPHKGDEGEGKAFGGGWEGPQFVLTHRPPDELVDGITFVTDLETAVAESREAAGDGYVNVIGADVARQLIEVGELDEVLAIVAPVLLGDGTRLFDWPGGHDVRLERIHLSDVPHATNLWFRVLR
jgi:dihydrofolate reductase